MDQMLSANKGFVVVVVVVIELSARGTSTSAFYRVELCMS